MPIDDSIASTVVSNSLAGALSRLRYDAVILSGLDTWDSSVYPGETVFLAKFMRIEDINCGYLHPTGEREFQAKFSAEVEAIANLVLAILNSDVLPAVVRCLTKIIDQLRIPALRIEIIYRKFAEGEEFTCLRAEGNADSVLHALREVTDHVHSKQAEK